MHAFGFTPIAIVPSSVFVHRVEERLRFSDECGILTDVSKTTSIDTYQPVALVSLSSIGAPNHLVRDCVFGPIKAMLIDAGTNGLDIRIVSAYRSFENQDELFEGYAQVYGVEQANTFSAMPGYSEHQLGTALDFGNAMRPGLSQEYGNEPEGMWLSKNSYRYGFTQSYPESKTKVTGYIYEPWHYRYVGIPLATYLWEHDLLIEEIDFEVIQ